jgi:hypothetical protein
MGETVASLQLRIMYAKRSRSLIVRCALSNTCSSALTKLCNHTCSLLPNGATIRLFRDIRLTAFSESDPKDKQQRDETFSKIAFGPDYDRIKRLHHLNDHMCVSPTALFSLLS